MKKQKNNLDEAVSALKNEIVPPCPPQETIDTTLQKLMEAESGTIKSRSTITEKIKAMKSFAKIAVVTAIIITIGIWVVRQGPSEQTDNLEIAEVAKSPAEMLTVSSLNSAYRQGGMDAVEKQYDQVLEMLGTQSTKISTQELLQSLMEHN